MSIIKKPPLNWVVNTETTIFIILLFSLIHNGNGEPYNSASVGGGVGIFIHGTNLGSSSNLGSSISSIDHKCPRVCICTGPTVDCAHRELQQVPRRIPLDTERL